MSGIDVHQHLLPDLLAEALRARAKPPFIRGAMLHVADREPVRLAARDYDLTVREAQLQADGLDLAVVSLSSPLGVESLPSTESHRLLATYHEAVDDLPPRFQGWAGACMAEPSRGDLVEQLRRGRVGLQVPATAVSTPTGWERLGELLAVLEEHDRPLLVHPGPAAPPEGALPSWWLPVVPFVSQLHASWFAWRAWGCANHPSLRVCFVGLAGLAPLHTERLAARGGESGGADARAFFETSSYGPQALSAMRSCVGNDVLVLGSDRPYAAPTVTGEDASSFAVRSINPLRLLGAGGRPS